MKLPNPSRTPLPNNEWRKCVECDAFWNYDDTCPNGHLTYTSYVGESKARVSITCDLNGHTSCTRPWCACECHANNAPVGEFWPHKLDILNERAAIYGDPKINFDCAARLISILLGHPVSASQVALIFVCVKLARIITGKEHEDNWVDLVGYAELAKMLR